MATHICLGTTPTIQQTMVFDHVTLDEVNRAASVRRAASGKPVNVARVLHTLGESPLLCIPTGGDTGAILRADLDASGIRHRCVEVAAITRTCVTVIDRASGAATEFVEEAGPLTAQNVADLLAGLRDAASEGDFKTVVLSGSLAEGVGDDFYAECCKAADEAPVIVDARGPALQKTLPFHPLVVKPNRSELAATLGMPIHGDPQLRRAIAALQEQGPQWVVVTQGRQGAIVSNGRSFWRVAALLVEAISPIGSGDAFAAGLCAGIAQGREIPDACRLATACAAANAMVPGAGFLNVADVQRLEPQVRVERW